MTGKVAYLMSRFPHLPETFILREMTELRAQGWQVSLYPLIHQEQTLVHREAQDWLPRAHRASLTSGRVIAANLAAFARHPLQMLRVWFQALRENAGDLGFLARTLILLPKAVYYAGEMQAEGVEHIHAHYATHPALAAWVIHRLTGIGYSVTVHAHDIFVSQSMLATKLRESDFIVAISEYNRSFLSETVGPWVEAKTHVIHCGIEPALYTFGEPQRQEDRSEDRSQDRSEDRSQDRSEDRSQDRSQDRFEILNIGSLQPYKGQRYLIEACALLKARGVPFHCKIIGGGDPAELQRQIDSCGLRQEVQLVGPLEQAEVARRIKAADCYVQPSVITPSGKMEGIPVAIMEALAGRRPVVATAISGVPELVQPGKTGYLVPPADAQALADALEHVYRHPAQADELAAAGQALTLAEFNLHNNVEQLRNLFQREIGEVAPAATQPPRLAPTYQE